jgi:MFS family permease
MSMGWAVLLLAVAVAVALLGRLSQRMSQVTQTPPYYYGLYLASLFIVVAAGLTLALRTGILANLPEIVQNSLQVVIADALAALGITITLPIAWYYWSWLLSERD